MTDIILRKNDIEHVTGLTERQVRRLEEMGQFPKRVKLSQGGRAIGWRASEVQVWIETREAA